MSLVSVDDVSYGYLPPDLNSSPFSDGPAPDRQTAEQLRGITMTIEPGTLTLLVGASGSGKSTLLRTMNGLVPKFYGGTLRGRVTVHGIDLADVELHDVGRTSAMIFQNPHTQFFTSSVRTELAFGLENYGVDAADIREAVTRAVARTGISHLLDRQLDTLSGGELQRVACACALAADVDLLLFDEPTSNLSAEGIDDFRTLVMELMDAGKTLVIAEHRLHLFRGLANVVNRISDGQIVERMSGDDFFALSEDDLLGRGLRSIDVKPVDLPTPPHARVGRSPVLRGRSTRSGSTSGNRGKPSAGLTIEHLTFSYPHRPVVLDIDSLFLPAGVVTILTGANGGGKSTLARLICGLEKAPPEARIGMGEPWSPRQASEMVWDGDAGFFSESVECEVTLGLGAPQRAAADVSGLLGRLDLADERDRHPLSLSGGQAQRLVVAATIAQDKDVVIFDEPTSGVDRHHLMSIARAVLADTPILVLDEATAAVDPDCEAEIQQALAALARGRTVLVIGHHAESVEGSNR
ncbi:ABC transporter ATP-binding protein (putative cobalt transport system) [Cutibacterium modestum 30N]|jgi:energy-coupling factor transporter ATP-binding protein EcfA2|uniref:ABC transporter n=2 Tax=Cutibacterium modestum TaxID=2559073 RepID=A0AAD1NWX9_9ACTN|nr:ABC transporter ATP-binding protein [Cutibacterium modestum]EGG26249.1 ABC transport system, ATP-binding protein [Cutibacterium modestum P08]MCP2377005.1 ABC transporter ATP-binding protein (putative cobalt transport system) [Cutibacterium modestum 28N]MCP2381609.1 ABC transporter ATP-binding protein (putative cobalt transport system) [Cutibacterium modestum 30N]BCY26229.1 ABC transporter [Cutibacterium modestum]